MHNEKTTIFIDGSSGTAGLRIYDRLAQREDIDLLTLPPELHHNIKAQRELINRADIAFLCLPDAAAITAADLVENPDTVVLDTSTAHRTAPGWTYGFPELSPEREAAIRTAKRIAVPGCHASAFILAVRPLVDAGVLPTDYPVALPSVSGYSGGGRQMIEAYEAGGAAPYELYALGLSHKHIPEIMAYSGLTRKPIFVPSVGNFDQGMLVQLPLHFDLLQGEQTVEHLHAIYRRHYDGSEYVTAPDPTADNKLDAVALKDTNNLEIRVYGNDGSQQAVAVARLDNLGKGASGAAVQNLQLMLGL